MTVRVGESKSELLPVNAGAPQGSVLRCYLFNKGVDDLEDELNIINPDQGQSEAFEETMSRLDDFPAAFTPLCVRSTQNDLLDSSTTRQ